MTEKKTVSKEVNHNICYMPLSELRTQIDTLIETYGVDAYFNIVQQYDDFNTVICYNRLETDVEFLARKQYEDRLTRLRRAEYHLLKKEFER